MRRLIVLALLLAACGDDRGMTWGEVSHEFARDVCQTYKDHCTSFDVDVELCAEHGEWHACVPDDTCDVEVDADAAEAALAECHRAMNPEPGDMYDYDTICLIFMLGFLPSGCDDVAALHPG